MMSAVSTSTDRVRQLIEDSGQSQGDFAVAVGLDPSKMSKSLAGARRLSSLDLARIAHHAGVTVDWLLSGEETQVAVAARRAAGGSTEVAVRRARQLVDLRTSAVRLGFPQRWPDVPPPVERGLAYEQGATLAGEALGVVANAGRSTPELGLADLLESVFGVDVCLTDLGDRVDGVAASTDQARLILASVSEVPYRQRFTLAHELGHLLAGDDQGMHLDQDIFARAGSDRSETRANAFAAAFLMPEAQLREAVGPGFGQQEFARLVMTLHVSPNALAFRLSALRLIDELTASELRTMSAKEAARLADEGALLAEATTSSLTERAPARLAADLLAAYLDGTSTLRPYAVLMQVDTETLRARLERDAVTGE